MLNAEITHVFTETYNAEVGTLLADLQLQEIRLCISEGKPDRAKTNPSIVSSFWVEDDPERCYFMAFNWDNIVDSRRDLHHGLVVFACGLRRIFQHETGLLKGDIWNGPVGMPGKPSAAQIADHDALHYAYDAVHRLFGLFSDEEIKAMKVGSCLCKSCRKRVLRRLPRSVRTDPAVMR
jgi:hypothetical protein